MSDLRILEICRLDQEIG